MRIMGLDVGEKRIGVAVSDELCLTAQGLKVIERKNYKADISMIKDIAEQNNIITIVVGLPKNMDNTVGFQAQKVLDFIALLKTDNDCYNIITWDERLSTKTAENILIAADTSRKKRRKVVDKIAAAVILQGYLDSSQFAKYKLSGCNN